MEFSRCEARISLDAILNNMEEMHRLISKDTKMIAVIKADGYGHGSREIAQAIEPLDYLEGFATATIEEAVTLRKAGVKKMILVLGHVFPECYDLALDHEIRLPIFTYESAKAFSDAAVAAGKTGYVHFKIDTGMKRIGFQVTEANADVIAKIKALPNLECEGIFTHFYLSDAADKTQAYEQLDRFKNMIKMVNDRGVELTYYHCSNSAGIIDLPEANMDLVRAGITLYGLWPSDEVLKERIYLEPVMSIYARVTHVKDLEEGETVGYGATYTAPGKRRLATIGFGYADGYPRQLSNKGWVLIHGKKCRICGRVCMDQFMVDVTALEENDPVKVGDVATLIGRDGDECITMEMMGDLSGRFNYEFACDINPRVPRVYVRDEKVVSTRTNF